MSPKRVFVVVYHRDHGYLVLYKNKHEGQLVGGRTEANEKNPVESLIREMFEETGLVVDKDKFQYLGSIDSKNFYYLEISSTDIKLSNEHQFYKFVESRHKLKDEIKHHSGGTCLKAIIKYL